MRTRSSSASPRRIGLSILLSCFFAEVGAVDEAQRIAGVSPQCWRHSVVGRPAARFPPAERALPAPTVARLPSPQCCSDRFGDRAVSAGSGRSGRRAAQPPSAARAAETDASATSSGPTLSASLSLDAVTELSYAMAHARIVPVQEVRLSYEGPELRGASLVIEASTASGSLGAPKVCVSSTSRRSQDSHWPRLLSLDPAPMLQVETEQPGSITLTLRGRRHGDRRSSASGHLAGREPVDRPRACTSASSSWHPSSSRRRPR